MLLLEKLEDELEKGGTVPFTSRAMINREQCLELIKEIRIRLPDDFKQAQVIMNEKNDIIADAQKQAENIIHEAQAQAQALVDQNEITKKAYERAREIINNAQKNAREIRLGANDYADEVLNKLDIYISTLLDDIRKDRAELKKSYHQT
mgnify:FL=1